MKILKELKARLKGERMEKLPIAPKISFLLPEARVPQAPYDGPVTPRIDPRSPRGLIQGQSRYQKAAARQERRAAKRACDIQRATEGNYK